MVEDTFENWILLLETQTLTDELKQDIIEKFYDYKYNEL